MPMVMPFCVWDSQPATKPSTLVIAPELQNAKAMFVESLVEGLLEVFG